jgi:hypothetical protein
MKKPKILFYDIETSPNLSATWGKWKQDVPAFIKEREMLSLAYSWNDGPVKVISREFHPTDKWLAREAGKLLQEADITVAHYGDKFDRPFIKTRLLKHKLPTLKMNCSVDTKMVLSGNFNLNSNSLGDACNYLGIGKKMPNAGIQMWLDCMGPQWNCMGGVSKSWHHMRMYNKHDVILLRGLYTYLRSWIENHPNVARLLNPYVRTLGVCPTCTSKDVQKYGHRPTVAGIRQRWLCNSCGRQFVTRMEK